MTSSDAPAELTLEGAHEEFRQTLVGAARQLELTAQTFRALADHGDLTMTALGISAALRSGARHACSPPWLHLFVAARTFLLDFRCGQPACGDERAN